MTNTYHGVSVNFGMPGTSVGSATGQFQTNDHGLTSDNEIIRDGTGAEITKTYYAFKSTATFEYVATGAGGPSGAAGVVYPAVGQMVTVTDTNYTNLASTYWLIESVDVKRSNTTSARVSLKLTLYPSITQ